MLFKVASDDTEKIIAGLSVFWSLSVM
jgi:hypothetical protein